MSRSSFLPVDFRSSRSENAEETDRRSRNFDWWFQRIKMKLVTKRTLAFFSIACAFAACGLLGPQEQFREEPGSARYRVPESTAVAPAEITPVPEKVPGESR